MGHQVFRVVIVGGGIAGLTMANALEQLKIDYILLEAYEKIAPVLGACIAITANGGRILDQLGCYEPLRQHDLCNKMTLFSRGHKLVEINRLAEMSQKRVGYVSCFRDRRDLLNILYSNLQDKSKILVNKRAVEIKTNLSGATVLTQDGSEYRGDVVVGADGIHSIVRREMSRLSSLESPRLFPENNTNVPIEYRIAFGVSTPKRDMGLETTVNFAANDGFNHFTVFTKSGSHYWFLFEKLDKALTLDDNPRYTKEDAAKLCEAHLDDVVYTGIKFGELYESSTGLGIAAVEETVFDRWHYRRILAIGDSSHKINPVTGVGASNAIETVACFANEIKKMLDQTGSQPSEAAVEKALSGIRPQRTEKVMKILNEARSRQKIEARESPIINLMIPMLGNILGVDALAEAQVGAALSAQRIEALPMPQRRRFVPFEDELPVKKASRATSKALKYASVLSFAGLAYYAKKLAASSATSPSVLGTLWAALRGQTLGLAAAHSVQPLGRLQATYATIAAASTMAMWTVERYRRGNKQLPLSQLLRFPSTFAAALDVYGAKTLVPVYYLLSVLKDFNPICERTSARPVEEAGAESILPALGLSVGISHLLSFLSTKYLPAGNGLPAWKLASLLMAPLSSIICSHKKRKQPPMDAPDSAPLPDMTNDDLPALATSYVAIFAIASLAHLGLVSVPWVFGSKSAAETVKTLLATPDLAVLGGGLSIWTLYSIVNLRRTGYTTTRKMFRTLFTSLVSLPLLGPVATYAAVALWREDNIADQCLGY